MLVNICIKFHEDILNGFQVTERTRFCDGQTDRRTDGRTDGQTDRRTDDPGKNNMSPNPNGGDIIIFPHVSVVFLYKFGQNPPILSGDRVQKNAHFYNLYSVVT